MDYKFLFYCFLSVVIITGGAFYFYSARQEVTAAIFFLGALVATIVFGLRWFSSSGDPIKANTGAWPPAINYCPDLLTLATVNDKQVCIDTVGVGRSGGIEVSDGTQTSDKNIFQLYLTETGNTRSTKLCEQCKTKEVTWEGVWDGSSCMGTDPPKPPTS